MRGRAALITLESELEAYGRCSLESLIAGSVKDLKIRRIEETVDRHMNNAKLDLEKRFDSKKERVLQKINLLKS